MKTRSLFFTLLLSVSTASFANGAAAVQPVALPSLAPLIDSVKGAVVNLDVTRKVNGEMGSRFERYARRRGGDSEDGPVNSGSGSGFIIDGKGLLITNNHVVEDAITIKVRLSDGRSLDGKVIGRDPLTDVALVQVTGKFEVLPFVKLGDSGVLRVGDWVVAIGNPFGLAHSVSTGIISASERNIGASNYDQFLQTDAAINPGNSGGPLFNLKGEVIGMNTAILGSATGIGFAVPSSLVKAVVTQLQTNGAVVRGWLGVGVQDVTPTLARALGLPAKDGALITSVNEGSPAKKAGILEEDAVLAMDGEVVTSSSFLTRSVALKRPDSMVALLVSRKGKTLELKVKLGTRPDFEKVGDTRSPKAPDGNQHRIGLAFDNVDARTAESLGIPMTGAFIVDVVPASPADEAGFRKGMTVTELNRKPVKNKEELSRGLKQLPPGSSALFRILSPNGSSSFVALDMP